MDDFCIRMLHGFALQTWLDGSWSCLSFRLSGAQGTVDGDLDPAAARGGKFQTVFAKLLWPFLRLMQLYVNAEFAHFGQKC